MDALVSAHATLEKRSNLSKTLNSVQGLIDQLQTTRDAVADNPDNSALHMAKAKTPIKKSFDRIEDDLKDVNKGLNQYQKALKDKFKSGGAGLPSGGSDLLSREQGLVERAVAMHLLREGMFDVASTFVKQVDGRRREAGVESEDQEMPDGAEPSSWLQEFADPDVMQDNADEHEEDEYDIERGHLQRKFTEMYHILDSLRNHHDLGPAISWSRKHSKALEQRGSNLEFELSRLKFVELFTSSSHQDTMSDADPSPLSSTVAALDYARVTFPTFSARYTRETASLLGSLAFSSALDTSPYHALFYNQTTWEDVSASFTREFCGMLGLSSQSPLYLACTAGGIALPILEKVERVMAQTRGQWTSENELPVETPLPPGFVFHNIFVCPVSKEQATDENPPMMMPCGHVIAKESLDAHSRGKPRMKCPYCPNESRPSEAKRIYI